MGAATLPRRLLPFLGSMGSAVHLARAVRSHHTCTVAIAANAPYGTRPLTIGHVILSDPSGTAVPNATGIDGTVIVQNACAGDCHGDGAVTADEVMTLVGVLLGTQPMSVCPAGDTDHNGVITIDELLQAIGKLLNGC